MLMYLKAVKTFPPQQNLQNTCASLSNRSLFQRKEDITQAKIGDICLLFFYDLAMRVFSVCFYPARARARRACALRALGLLLADGTPTGGRGEDFLSCQPDFFTETAVTSERKVEKSFPRWEINRHVEG